MPHHRDVDTVLPVHPPVIQPPMIAHEVLVHVLIRTRTQTHHDVVARLDDHVAALRAVRTHRRGAIELPRARLVERILREQRADGTELDDVSGPWMCEV